MLTLFSPSAILHTRAILRSRQRACLPRNFDRSLVITNHFLPQLLPITSSEIYILPIFISLRVNNVHHPQRVGLHIHFNGLVFLLSFLDPCKDRWFSFLSLLLIRGPSLLFLYWMSYCCLLMTSKGSKVKGILSRNRPRQSGAPIQRSHTLGQHSRELEKGYQSNSDYFFHDFV